jgi:hypothetical protein
MKKETPENTLELVDDKPETVRTDLRKFNRTQQVVDATILNLRAITKVADQDDLDAAMVTLKVAAEVANKVEAKRKELKDPFYKAGVAIDSKAKELIKEVGPEVTRVKQLILGYNNELILKRVAQQAQDRANQLLGIKMAPDPVIEHRYAFEDVVIEPAQLLNYTPEAWNLLLSDTVVKIQELQETKLRKLQAAKQDDFFGAPDITEIDKKIDEIKALTPAPSFGGSWGGSSSGKSTAVKGVTKTWTYEVTEAKVREAIKNGLRRCEGLNIYQKEGLAVR